MNPKLDRHQQEAVNKLRNGNILIGEVGSGKSRVGIAWYFCKVCGGMINGKSKGLESDYVPMSYPMDLYIITTAKKRDKREWEHELIPFLLSTNPADSFYGDKVKVVVDSWNNIQKYVGVRNACFLFDEQRVVGYGAWSKAFIQIAKYNRWIFLTATPGDCWMDYLAIFIANGFFKNKSDFVRQHVIYDRYSKFPKVDKYVDDYILRQMRDSILVTINYTKPTERHIITTLVDYDKEAYRLLMRDRWNIFENKPIENISELCYLLRKTVNADPTRGEACIEIAKQHPRIIVFYSFDYELEILRNLDWPDGTVVQEWNGHKHEEIPDSERWVYLVNYRGGSEGWNCIDTDTMLFYSQDYSYKTTEQAMGRIDRRNTPYHDLYYYNFKTFAPIDVAISRALKRKKTFNESAFFKQRSAS